MGQVSGLVRHRRCEHVAQRLKTHIEFHGQPFLSASKKSAGGQCGRDAPAGWRNVAEKTFALLGQDQLAQRGLAQAVDDPLMVDLDLVPTGQQRLTRHTQHARRSGSHRFGWQDRWRRGVVGVHVGKIK
jgi:hypothetical protein